MTKRIISVALLFVLIFSISAQASGLRAISNRPGLAFNGTNATCSVDCKSVNSSDTISATLTLYQGSTYVDSWSETGSGRVIISETCSVESGKDYKLVLSYTINGKTQSSVSVTGKCP